MRKKLLSLILGAILFTSVFAGCSLIEHNYEKDARQVVAVIDPIEDTDRSSGIPITFKSETKYIYKSQLTSAMNSYGNTYMSNYGYTAEQTADALLDELITRELLIIEAERLLEQEKIEWTKADVNTYKRYIYNAIDSQLTNIKNNVKTDFGETVSSSTSNDNTNTSTTYPTPDAETTDEDYTDYVWEKGKIVYETKQKQVRDENGNKLYNEDGTAQMVDVEEPLKDGNGNVILGADDKPVMVPVEVPKIKEWEPKLYDYPGMFGSEKEKSRDREAMRRFIAQIKELPDNDFRVTDSDRAKFDADFKKIDKTINEQGIEYVYPMLGDTYLMEYFVGVSARESILISKLQEYIVGSVTVTNEDIVKAYTNQLTQQTETYGPSRDAYQSALSTDADKVIYLRDDSCFFVKHILLPFSDEQKAMIDEYNKKPENAGQDTSAYRLNMVNSIVVYPHVNGEDDLSRPMTVKQVFDIVKSEMSPLKASVREAERKFDELTYTYNTDPGAFGLGKAYMVKRNDSANSGYVEEFYKGAMKLYNDGYSVGEVLPEYVVTDFGVHIMYFARKITPGIRELGDYLTYGEYKTVRETFEETIRTTKENSAFTSWQNERITYYRERAEKVHTYKDRYESLYED